jgi:RNA polymerase sigma factor (sigma-70 family)
MLGDIGVCPYNGYMLNNNETITAVLPAIRLTVARFVPRTAMGRDEMIEDLTNDVVVKLLAGGLDKCDGRASAKSWATIVARNTVLDSIRLHRNAKAHTDTNHSDFVPNTDSLSEGESNTYHGTIIAGPDGQEVAEAAIENSRLQAAMLALLDAQECSFMIALARGVDAKTAGEANGWSKATSSRRKAAILATLSEELG